MGAAPLSLLRFSMRHEYGPIPKILQLAPRALISNLGEDRGHLFEVGGGGVLNRGGLFNFSQIMTWYDHFFNTSSVQKQHKLLIVKKNLILNYCGTVSTCNFFKKFKCVHKLKQCTNLILQGKNYTPLAVSLLNCSQNGGGGCSF